MVDLKQMQQDIIASRVYTGSKVVSSTLGRIKELLFGKDDQK